MRSATEGTPRTTFRAGHVLMMSDPSADHKKGMTSLEGDCGRFSCVVQRFVSLAAAETKLGSGRGAKLNPPKTFPVPVPQTKDSLALGRRIIFIVMLGRQGTVCILELSLIHHRSVASESSLGIAPPVGGNGALVSMVQFICHTVEHSASYVIISS